MLHLGGDDVVPLLGIGEGHPADGQVVRLATPTGEDYLIRMTAQELGHLLPGPHHPPLGLCPPGMGAGWVAKFSLEPGEHRLQDLGMQGGSGVVIKIDRFHGNKSMLRVYWENLPSVVLVLT